ncbi:hypothetical protein [Hydrogenibacillus sp. N12]|uniref:hypothetical protein n=1 Tax=Hydrogenibacillus sp. N12 TaxID=2866627 RepID=UPI001C7CCFD0|nr:hypothetical protein [Hydrogenibacillus sp. N12]QZA33746.1 hypothetical protein K2M58_04320 [Hydrogenibacillus sp. N12]
MNIQRLDAELFCPRCRRETTHALEYAGDILLRVTCTECGATLRKPVDPTWLLSRDLLERLRTKPKRLQAEWQSTGALRFALTVPVRMTTKPFRLYREIKENLAHLSGADRR